MATQVRQRLGESIATIEKYSRPLEEATTASLDAWKAFTTATQVYGSSGRARLNRCSSGRSRSIRTSRSPMRRLGIYYSNLGESALSRQSTIKAYQLRHRASDAERFFIETVYAGRSPATWTGEMETLEAWAQTYPRDPIPHGLLAGFATGAPANTSGRSPRPRGQWLLIPKEAPHVHTAEGIQRTLPESPGRGRGHYPSSGRAQACLRRFPDSLLHRVLERRCRRHESAGRDRQSQALHGRLDVAS